MKDGIEMGGAPDRSAGFGFMLLVGTGLLWGTIGIAAEQLYRTTDLDPVGVTWLRAVIAALVCVGMAGTALRRQLFRSSRRDLALMVLLGLVLIVYQWLYFSAVARVGVAAATLVALCGSPVLIVFVSIVWLGVPPTRRSVTALIGALIGTGLLVGGHVAVGKEFGATLIGVAMAVAAAAGMACHVLLSRHIAGRQHPLRPLAIGFPAGAIAFLPVAAGHGVSFHLPVSGWLLLLYLGIVPSALAYVMYQRGLRDVPATTASIIILLEPLIAAILARLLFGERLGALGLVGAALLMGAIVLLSRGGAATTQPANEAAATSAFQKT